MHCRDCSGLSVTFCSFTSIVTWLSDETNTRPHAPQIVGMVSHLLAALPQTCRLPMFDESSESATGGRSFGLSSLLINQQLGKHTCDCGTCFFLDTKSGFWWISNLLVFLFAFDLAAVVYRFSLPLLRLFQPPGCSALVGSRLRNGPRKRWIAAPGGPSRTEPGRATPRKMAEVAGGGFGVRGGSDGRSGP